MSQQQKTIAEWIETLSDDQSTTASLTSDVTSLYALVIEPIGFDAQTDIDELVHTYAESDEDIDTSGEVDDFAIDLVRSLHATSINNQGLYEQLRYLEAQGAYINEVAAILSNADGISNHARLQLTQYSKS